MLIRLTRRASLFAAVAAMFCALMAPALGNPIQKLPDAMYAPILAVVTAMNTGNASRLNGAFTADAVVVDEFAPYQWSGPHAAQDWWSDFGTLSKAIGLTYPKVIPQMPKWMDATKSRAYVVFPTIFLAMVKGKPDKETGQWSFVLVKRAAGWQISSMAWAKVSEKM